MRGYLYLLNVHVTNIWPSVYALPALDVACWIIGTTAAEPSLITMWLLSSFLSQWARLVDDCDDTRNARKASIEVGPIALATFTVSNVID